MTIKGGTNPACAACKYQRRKCIKDCPLAPYFPPDQPLMFQNAHRLFGVSNIVKILTHLKDDQKDEAMRSIIYEANMRARFPVHGCRGIIGQLLHQLQETAEELLDVRTQLAAYHAQQQQQRQVQLNSFINMENNFHYPFANGVSDYNESDDNMIQSLTLHSPESTIPLQYPLVASHNFPIQQGVEVVHDYDAIPFDAMADDKQSYIESNEVCDSSVESPGVDTTNPSQDSLKNDLKNAASCFGLTSFN